MTTGKTNRGMRRPASSHALLARAVDVALVVAGAAAASRMRFGNPLGGSVDALFVAFAAALAWALFPVFGIYQSWRGRPVPQLAGRMSLAWLVVQASGLVLMFSMHRTDLVSRLWFAYWTGVTGGALIASRLAAYAGLSRARNAGLNLRKVVVVGCGPHSREVLRHIDESPASGFRAVAAFDLRPTLAPVSTDLPVFDDFAALARYVRQEGVREIWLALPLSEEQAILRFTHEFCDELINIRFIPDVSSISLFGSGMIDMLGVPALDLVASPLPSQALLQKAIFDLVFGTLAIVALAPLMIVIAIAVKLSSAGPVLFRQARKGADGRVFDIYKFRTMRQHAQEPGVVKQATRHDARVTKVGALLRRTSFDELPQFFNVLRGDMSVVGPRPHAIEHDEIYRKVIDG
ncbi:MAG: hypothetical protein QOI13_3160, partial [Paraburkholderia sp.]|nr:hypothetical protein [Paraburkholderia sp.]